MQSCGVSDFRELPQSRAACRSRARVGHRFRMRTFAYTITATAPGDHAWNCAARLDPVEALRSGFPWAPTPHGADGLDRAFGRAGGWLLRDGPATTDIATPECPRLEPQELDAVVAFVRILLEWDARTRTMIERADSATEGALSDDGDERIDARGAVCAGVE